ncbi:MCE family protein [Mycolicibacterium palauense]|uniref:MCE family protein n=1 Tax=Mycolicibacterium palauense TaxID=2034511 RepID=UPI000BFEAC3A|nr:MCE family protein [Mycolicibacterium palauense]
MRDSLSGTIWRLVAFASVCLLGLFMLVAVFGHLRFDRNYSYTAEFTNVGGLKGGDFVRIAGVEVGQVETLAMQPNATVNVVFSVDDSVRLDDASRAVIRYDNLYGERYLALEEGPTGGQTLAPGGVIPLSRTEPALDLDTLIGGFRPLFRALDPDQVNLLASQLIQAFQGQGATIGSFLTHTADLTNTLAEHDELIGQAITNLNVVFGSFADGNAEFGQAVDALAALTGKLAERKEDVVNSVAYSNAAAGALADLLKRSRPALQKITDQTDRAAGIVLNERDYVDDLLNTLPDAYQKLGRQGLYGDWFSFYVCEVIFKVNGKGGQPVYIKAAGQSSGRCTPK